MNDVELLVVAGLAVLAVAALVVWASQRRRSAELRRRFGPEYARTVEGARDRGEAEKELRARQERVDALEIRSLEPAARDRHAERWREVQAMFVDDPESAVDQADTLIGEVMRARGYPVGDFEQRAADISVNHPHVVDHYRTAHSIAIKQRSGDGATEQLRQAFVHYRALFADLLEVPGTTGTDRSTEVEASPSAASARPGEPPPGQRSRLASRPATATPSDTTPPDAGTTAGSAEPVDSRSAR